MRDAGNDDFPEVHQRGIERLAHLRWRLGKLLPEVTGLKARQDRHVAHVGQIVRHPVRDFVSEAAEVLGRLITHCGTH